jgi:hypothetical protein
MRTATKKKGGFIEARAINERLRTLLCGKQLAYEYQVVASIRSTSNHASYTDVQSSNEKLECRSATNLYKEVTRNHGPHYSFLHLMERGRQYR